MPHFDAVFDVLEGYNTIADFLVRRSCFSGGKKMLDDLNYPLTKRGTEILEYEVWVGFTDSPFASVWKIVAEGYIMQGKGRRWTVR